MPFGPGTPSPHPMQIIHPVSSALHHPCYLHNYSSKSSSPHVSTGSSCLTSPFSITTLCPALRMLQGIESILIITPVPYCSIPCLLLGTSTIELS
ncbi:hypothetical protein CEXT_489101 [Caerostris extrusa]|uniref:Uncharacterized protein n=1 Tax=Caerostris extrusa TaxID=172846 RepID=A0AAV4PR22_CAEEX|nr:hypothetical protein CEXT_489101 [Caerostris extrusa]